MADAGGCVPALVGNVSQLLTFLMTLQAAALHSVGDAPVFDPKTYVDLPLRYPLQRTEAAFLELPRMPDGGIPSVNLQAFLAEFFDQPGSELVQAVPKDFVPVPENFLPKVRNKEVRDWGLQVHSLWYNLTRRVKEDVAAMPGQHTILPLKAAFVVPGSRFREVYYWDSYWILRGLLVSRMVDTARGLVDNLLSLVELFGFVPNGARTYYTNRSQPPLLSKMVQALFRATGDYALLRRALPVLLSEHKFWSSAPHLVTIEGSDGRKHVLSRYYAAWDAPRPESSTIDEALAQQVPENRRTQLYRDIATGAETGWDFSSRWMGDRTNLSTLRTTLIVPADLNSILFEMEGNIRRFAKLLRDSNVEEEYAGIAAARKAAIEAILWNEEKSQWLDYWLPSEPCPADQDHRFDPLLQNAQVLASNFVPIWCGLVPHTAAGKEQAEKVKEALLRSGLVQPAGIATSLLNTGEQWDFPNGWAPLQHMIIEGLAASSRRARETASDIAHKWLRTNFGAFVKSGVMHEKYNVTECGAYGGGGEYAPQTGFGWSNGVVLALLHQFGWPLDSPIPCHSL